MHPLARTGQPPVRHRRIEDRAASPSDGPAATAVDVRLYEDLRPALRPGAGPDLWTRELPED
ncbi:hypothetical protein ACRAWF_17455 [Streptomyces sp. L7]